MVKPYGTLYGYTNIVFTPYISRYGERSYLEVGHLIGSDEVSYLYKFKQVKEPALSFILFRSTNKRVFVSLQKLKKNCFDFYRFIISINKLVVV